VRSRTVPRGSSRCERGGQTDTNLQSHRGNRLLAALAPKAFELMRPDLRLISLKQSHELYQPGDDIDQIYFPQTGLLSLRVVTKNGRFVETSTIGREGAVGLHAGLGPRCSFTRAAVQIGGNFSVIRANRFASIVREDQSLRGLITRYIEVLWVEAQQTAACNARHDASERLCRWLLQCADRIESDTVPLTQGFLAQMLAVQRVSVTLLAQSLKEQGLIKYSRGRIQILDRERLKHCACDCYHVIQSGGLMPSIDEKLI
jgi:CRP-like cAMP-binding protein